MKKITIGEDVITRVSNRQLFDIYANDLRKLDILTAVEEVELFKKIANGCKKSFDEIYAKNLRFVVSVAKHYDYVTNKSCLTLEDLISDGNLGLYTAIERFDHTRGFKFISYAVNWIRQAILQSLYKHVKHIRMPVNKLNQISKLTKLEEKLLQTHNRNISDVELYEAAFEAKILSPNADTALLEIADYYKLHNQRTVSNESTASNEIDIMDLLSDEGAVSPAQRVTNKDLLNRVMKIFDEVSMPTTVKNYFIDFFGLGGGACLSYTEIGLKYEENKGNVHKRMHTYMSKIRINDRKHLTAEKLEMLLIN